MQFARFTPVLLVLAAGPALSLAQAQPAACQVKDSSAAVVLMVCPPGTNAQAWRAAGLQACATRKDCNVWIWDDAADVPAKSPVTDADLPKDRTAKAVAIWVQQTQDLVTLKRVDTGK